MNLYFIAWNLPKELVPKILIEMGQMVEVYPQLDPETKWHYSSLCGTLFMSSMHTADLAAAPRSYVLQSDDQITLYSGLPVDPLGTYSAHRAEVLSAHWDHLAEKLEGQYVIIRSTHNPLRLELLTDFIGMEQVFYHRKGNMWFISNSVGLIERVSGRGSLDELGVSLFLSLGWAGDDRTLLSEVREIPGGQHWSWWKGEHEPSRRSYFVATSLISQPRKAANKHDIKRISDELLQLCKSLIQDFGKIRCPLTAGRDSRLLAALLTHAKLPAEFYTIGDPSSVDVRIASQISGTFGLSHEITSIKAVDVLNEWDNLCWRFVRQNDGLSSLWQIADVLYQASQIDNLGLTLYGIGGEIARGYYGAHGPLQYFFSRHRIVDVQQFLMNKINSFGGLVRQEAIKLARDYTNRFVEQCVDDGFNPIDVPTVFFTFQRVGRWGGNNTRRAVMVGDLFSPFCSRPFVTAAFSMSAMQRCTEPLHYNLLRLLAPELHSFPFDVKSWRIQQPLMNLLNLYGRSRIRPIRDHIRSHISHILRRLRQKKQTKTYPVFDRMNWFLAKREKIKEICLEQSNSSLWNFVDRPTFERILKPDTVTIDRSEYLNGLYQIVTLFYYDADRKARKMIGH